MHNTYVRLIRMPPADLHLKSAGNEAQTTGAATLTELKDFVHAANVLNRNARSAIDSWHTCSDTKTVRFKKKR